MSAIRTIDLLYTEREGSVNQMNGKMNGASDAVLYGTDGSRDSVAMADLLNEMGVAFEYRSVNRDPAASVAMAHEALLQAAERAHGAAELLAAAQAAINAQGYHLPDAHSDDEDG